MTGIAHRPFGPMRGWTYGNGLSRHLYYDQNYTPGDQRLTGITTMDGGVTRQSLLWSYDAADRRTAVTDVVTPGLTQVYGYDALSRLTSVTATGADQGFTWDANGNRTSHTWGGLTDGYTTAAANNRLTAITGPRATTYTYDNAGNTLSGEGTIFTYGVFGRMATATRAGTTTTYATNALGQRVHKKVGTGANQWFAYSGGLMLAEHDGSGWTHYVRLPNGEPVALVRGGQRYMIHTDHLGRPEIATNTAKAAVWRAGNYAFDRTVTMDTISGLNLGFPGQTYDAETGLWYNYFRTYNPRTGRYLESDPIGLGGGLNTYAYVGGDPINTVDPLGLFDIRAYRLPDGGYRYTTRFYSGSLGVVQRRGGAIAGGVAGRIGRIMNNASKLAPPLTGVSDARTIAQERQCDSMDAEAERIFNEQVNKTLYSQDEASMRHFLNAFFNTHPHMTAIYGGTDAMLDRAQERAMGWNGP